MIRKLITLATGTLLSLNASAGYVQYELSGPGVSGQNNSFGKSIMLIREEDKSVAFFNIVTNLGIFRPQERGESYHQNSLIETTTSFMDLGPTNMYMRDLQQEEYSSQMWLLFSSGQQAGMFNYTMRILRNPGPQSPYPNLIPRLDTTYTGSAKQVAVDADLANILDNSNQFLLPRDIPYFDATQVPEPVSIALFAIGAAAAAGATRRRKA